MKPICLACSAPLQNAPFSLSIKLNDISLPAPFMPCQVPPEMQADPGVTSVCWVRRGPLKAEANTETSAFQPLIASRRLLLWGDSCFENVSGEGVWAKEILDLKHGCFVFTWTRRLLQTDGKWKYLIMKGRFPSYEWFPILVSCICVEHKTWADISK